MKFSLGALGRALSSLASSLRSFLIPTAYAPTAPPGQPGGAPAPKQSSGGGASFSPSSLYASVLSAARPVGEFLSKAISQEGPLRTAYRENVPESVRVAIRKFSPFTAAGGQTISGAGVTNVGQTAFKATPPPPSQPSLPIGGFQGKTPALTTPSATLPGTSETRSPITTPAPAPTPAARPPVPTLPGGGGLFGGSGISLGGGGRVPFESPLPPTPTLPSETKKSLPEVSQPVGQFDAMIRALQALQGPSRFVQMPMAGVATFGPSSAQERALRRLRERELSRISGGIQANT